MRLDSYRTRGSNGVNDVRTAGRWYLGGRSEANAGSTVDRPIPDPAPTRFPGRSSRRRRSSVVVSATSRHGPPAIASGSPESPLLKAVRDRKVNRSGPVGGLQPDFGCDPSGVDGLFERGVVLLVLVGVSLREGRNRLVESVALS
jgi:hypothetical protein